jgi:hypothetical protein
MNWLKTLFSKFFGVFRTGLDSFLTANLTKAIHTAQVVIDRGGYKTTHEFVQLLWEELRVQFPNVAGTWLSILANLAVDVLKNKGEI